MKIYLYILLFVFPLLASGQSGNLDSLIKATQSMKEDTTKAVNLITISNKYRVEKIDYSNAKKYALDAIQLSEKINFPKGNFRATIALAYVTRDMGSNLEGIDLLKKAIAIYEGNKELTENNSLHITHVYTYTALADLYTYLPDYTNAQKYAFKALEFSEKYNTGIGQCWITLSIIFSKQKNLTEANTYALKAKDFFKQNNANDDLARTYAYLARYAFTAENYNQSIEYYKACYDAYKKANSLFGVRLAAYNLAEVYLKIKNYDKADYYINETLKINSASNDVIYSYYINLLKFNIEFDKKNYAEALKVCNLLLSLASKEKNLENINITYDKFLSIYKATKDTANAFLMSEKISSLKDSLYNIESAKHTAELAKKYEIEKKEQQISFLDKENKLNKEKLAKETLLATALKNENELKQEKLFQEHLLSEALTREIEQKLTIQNGLERENSLKKSELAKETLLNKTLQSENALMVENSKNESIIRWLMLAGLCSLIVFGIIYYRNYQKQKLANTKILKQKKDLRTLMKELHHRVKNNLQLTVSMLRMQARTIQDKAAVDALVSSENRLQSIAMVHEKLYKSDNVSGVLLKEYLQELMDVLTKQYENSVQNFSFTITDNAHLITNLDTAIPLGMIVNELVTNSFKYAFVSTANAIIQIQVDAIGNNKFRLTIQDNGIGFPDDQLPQKNSSLGLKLVHLFTEQLNGSLHYNYNNGSCFIINFS
jgi:two-component sensor histidine kinase